MKKFILIAVALMLLSAPMAFAGLVDTTGALGYYNGTDATVWQSTAIAPAGTGLFAPFVRLSNNGTEAGMNTDAGGPPGPTVYNDVSYNQYTRAIQFTDLQTSVLTLPTKPQTEYYIFALDINESAGGVAPLLSLDVFQIYQNASATLTTKPASGLVYQSPDVVLLNYDLSKSGQAIADLYVYIPTTSFATLDSTKPYLYLYSSFGAYTETGRTDFTSSDGPEEWRAQVGPNSHLLPEPGTLLLLGLGMLGLGIVSRRKK